MSSFFDEASLVFIPSGYKTSKAYSVKPTSGDGDLAFTRSNDTATRVGPDGLIEKVRTNLVPNGLLFNGATGVLYTTVTSDSPISGVSSTRITKNEAAGTLRYGNQNVSASVLTGSLIYTISRYFKYDGYNLTTSMEFNNSGQWGGTSWVQDIDIASTGVTLQAPSNCTSKITNVGNGWYRVDVTVLNGASPIGAPTHLLKVASALSTGQGFLTAAPQLETGDIATDYIATTSAAVSVGPVANVPRLDYLNSSCPRLLLEPQRSNSITFSEQIDNAAWTKGAVSVTSNNAVSPDGYSNADLITADGTTTQHFLLQTQTQSAKTISFFVKMGTQRFVQILTSGSVNALANYDLQTGAVGGIGSASTASMVDYGNGWWRLILTSTDALTGNPYLCYVDSLVQGRFPSTTSTGTIWVWGAMAENGATYASSYVNTLGAAVTRGADSASKTGISSLIGQTEGTIFWDFNVPSIVTAGTYTRVILSDGTSSNIIDLIFYSDGRIQFTAYVAGSIVVNIFLVSYGLTAGNHKFALAYKLNDYVAYVDGALAGADTSATVPAMSDLSLYNTVGGLSLLSQALLFKTRLTNAQLAELTTI